MSVSNNLAIAPICQYLASQDIATGNNLFGGNIVDPRTPEMIYMLNKSVSYINTNNPTNADLTNNNNYFYSWLSQYVPRANGIYGTSGGSIVVPGGSSGLVPYIIDITVVLSQTSGYTLTSTDNPNPWIGLQYVNQITINQNIFQIGSQFSYNSVTGVFDFTISSYKPQVGDVVTGSYFKAA